MRTGERHRAKDMIARIFIIHCMENKFTKFAPLCPKLNLRLSYKNKRASFEYEFIEHVYGGYCPDRNGDQIDPCRESITGGFVLLFFR
jgi:hypothetical protein